MSDNKKCLICLEDMETNQEYLPCAHSFHGNCIIPWLEQHDECPICKIPIIINMPEQLDAYNHNRRIHEEREEQERRFFHSLSNGNNLPLPPNMPPQNIHNAPDVHNDDGPGIHNGPNDPNIFAILSSVISTGSNLATQLNLQQQASQSNNTLMALVGLFDTLAQDGRIIYTRDEVYNSEDAGNNLEPEDSSEYIEDEDESDTST